MLMTLENVLNRGLPRSPRARQLCLELSGKSLAIEVRDITRVRLSSTGSTLALSVSEAPAEATLSGGPLALLGLLGSSPQQLLQRGDRHRGRGYATGAVISRAAHAAASGRRKRSCRCSSEMCRRTSSRAWRARVSPSDARPPRPPSRTPPSTSGMSAPSSCRARKGSSSCAAWTRCARTSIGCRRGWSCSHGGAARREATGGAAAAGDPARTAEARAR